MGCDIHAVVQYKTKNGWRNSKLRVFRERSYALFGFLADVRNYSGIEPLSQPRGIPEGFKSGLYSRWKCDWHSESWLSSKELAAIDFAQIVEDRRHAGKTLDKGEGKCQTLAEFLGKDNVRDIKKIARLKTGRVVFWFDN